MTRDRGDGPNERDAASLNTESAGRLLSSVVGYLTRKSAQRQAARWNALLQDGPNHGPNSAYVVRVSDRKDGDGTWKLVWDRRDAAQQGEDDSH